MLRFFIFCVIGLYNDWVLTGVVSQRGASTITKTICDFEDNTHFCGYVQDNTDTGSWTSGHGSASNSIPATGPIQDHTYGAPSGHYAYINGHSLAQNSHVSRTTVARLISHEFPESNGYCLRFAYNMHGVDIRTFNVYASIHGGLGYPIFKAEGNKGADWMIQEVNLDSEYTHTPFKVVFEAATGAYKTYDSFHGSYKYYKTSSNIAIDDFVSYNVPCANVPKCPDGSVIRTLPNGRRSCYNFHTVARSWYEANRACRSEGPDNHLLSIEDHAEQDFIVNYIKKNPALTTAGVNGYFTSGNDEMSERDFKWTETGTPQHMNITMWKPGQPNNVGDDQDCLMLEYPELNYAWGDVDCDEPHPYICELDE